MNIGTQLKKNQHEALGIAQRAKGLPADCGDPSGIIEACVDYAVSYIPKADVKVQVKKMEDALKPARMARTALVRAAMKQLGTGSRRDFPALAQQAQEFCDLYERTIPKENQQNGWIQTIRSATSPQKVYNALHKLSLHSDITDHRAKKVFEERIKDEFGLSDKTPDACC